MPNARLSAGNIPYGQVNNQALYPQLNLTQADTMHIKKQYLLF